MDWATSALLSDSGVLGYGLLGWLGDHYLGTKFLLPIGLSQELPRGVRDHRRFRRIHQRASATAAKDRGNQAAVTEHRHEAEKGER